MKMINNVDVAKQIESFQFVTNGAHKSPSSLSDLTDACFLASLRPRTY